MVINDCVGDICNRTPFASVLIRVWQPHYGLARCVLASCPLLMCRPAKVHKEGVGTVQGTVQEGRVAGSAAVEGDSVRADPVHCGGPRTRGVALGSGRNPVSVRLRVRALVLLSALPF